MKAKSKTIPAVLLLFILAWTVPAGGEEPADLLFVVDGSKNLGKGTGDRYIRGLVASLTSLLRPGIGRVGVTTFGGRIETTAENALVLPLTDIPSDWAAETRFFKDLEKTLAEKLTFPFSAADFNVPFVLPGGILDIVRQRDEERRTSPLLVLLISDGDFQVVEMIADENQALHSAAFEDYATAAVERFGDLNRDTVNRAAREALETDVIGILGGVRGLVLVPLSLKKGAAPAVLTRLATGWTEGPLSFDPQTFLPSLSSLRGILGAADMPNDRETLTLEPGQEVKRPLLLHQGLSRLVVGCAFDRPGVETTLTGTMGEDELAATGTQGYFPCFRFMRPTPGNLLLTIRNQGTEKARGSLILFRASSFSLALEVPSDDKSWFSGTEMPLRFRVRFGDPPATVTDPEVLRECVVVLALKKDGVAALEETRVSMANLEEGVKDFAFTLGNGSLEGSFELIAKLRVFRSENSVVTVPLRLPVKILRSIPVLEVEFEKADSFIGEKLRVVARITDGRMPQKPVIVTFRCDDERATATLYAGEDNALSGEIHFSRKGTWKVEARPSTNALSIEPGPRGIIRIRERTVGLYQMKDDRFEELEKITATLDLGKAKGTFQGAKFFLKADLKENEKGEMRITWKAPKNMSEWVQKMQVADKDVTVVELTESLSRREIGLLLTPPASYAAQGDTTIPAGTLVVSGKLGGTDVTREYPIEIRILQAPQPWYLHPLFFGACAAFLLLLGFLTWMLTAPHFAYQNLVLESEDEMGHPPYFFVDNAIGMRKNKAWGTDELVQSTCFKVKGKGKKAVCFLIPASGVEVKVNGRKVTGRFALTDGNIVEITKPGADPRTYRYFATAAGPEDLEDDEFVIMEYDEDEEFVVTDDMEELGDMVAPEEQAPAAEPAAAPEPAATEVSDGHTYEGVDLVSSPTAMPERFKEEMDAARTPFDEEATMAPAEEPAAAEAPEDVPAVDESAFGDFFEDDATFHGVPPEDAKPDPANEETLDQITPDEEERIGGIAPLNERIDESKDKTSHADMFDDAVTFMGFDGKTMKQVRKEKERIEKEEEALRKEKEEGEDPQAP
jgi:hypothetical protein